MKEPVVRSPHLLVAAFLGGGIFPSYPAIKLVSQLDFREMCTVDSITGTLVSLTSFQGPTMMCQIVSRDTAGSRM